MGDLLARVITAHLASMIELQTRYGTEDFYNLLEILNVNTYNRNVLTREA